MAVTLIRLSDAEIKAMVTLELHMLKIVADVKIVSSIEGSRLFIGGNYTVLEPAARTMSRHDFQHKVIKPLVTKFLLQQSIEPGGHVSVPSGDVQSVVEQITQARGPVYGPFLDNAIVAQNLKAAIRNIPDRDNNRRWEDLPFDVREGLDLIMLKVSRIMTGDPEYLDNWDDIGGYSKIVADRIRRTKAVAKG